MSKKLLITGGSGFVAYHIIAAAIDQGYDVDVSIRNKSAVDHLKAFNIQYISIDFLNQDSIVSTLKEKQYNYIVHVAGTTRAKNQEAYNQVNAAYSYNLASAAVTSGIPLKKFVFISSLAALGPTNNQALSDHYSPVTAYGKSKMLAEQMLSGIEGLPLIVFRPTAVYGPREKDIFIFFKMINRGLETYIGNLPQQMSFVYVKDLAKLVINALDTNIVSMTYNITDGNIYSRYDLSDAAKTLLRKKTIRMHLPVGVIKLMAGILETVGALQGKVPVLNRSKINELTGSWDYSIIPAKQDLDFNPVYDLKSGLEETILWYKQQGWL